MCAAADRHDARGWRLQDKRQQQAGGGKIMRRVLRARALGLPEGDLSTLEE